MSGLPGGDAWRRELRLYARRVIARDPIDLLRVGARALGARRARRGLPAGFAPSPFSAPSPLSPTRLPLRVRADREAPETVPLATRDWPLRAGAPWRARHDDPEDRFAAHRFSFTIPTLAAHGTAAVPGLRSLLSEWFSEHDHAGGDGWDSYSIAERLSASVYLQSALPHADAALEQAIRAHAAALASAVEFRGTSTNNHLINDARALYLAGTLLGDAALRHPARELLDFAVPRMFIEGFLREGSTHYHLLLLRTLLEVALAARVSGDDAFGERAAAWARESADAARFVGTAELDLPLFGDLSPDFTPGFLAGLAGAGPVTGWAALLAPASDTVAAVDQPVSARPRAGYYRAACGAFTLSAWVNPDGQVPAWSHAHADLGSFVASWHGRPLLVDCGRATYAPGAMSTFGRSVRSHNSISIDGHEPCIVHGLNGYPELFRSDYTTARPRARLSHADGIATFVVEHDGFGRLGSGIAARRRVAVSADAIEIEDHIAGSGSHRIETFFHFAPEATVTHQDGARWNVSRPGAASLVFDAGWDARLVRGQGGAAPMGWTSRRYGAADPSPSLVVDRQASLPLTARYRIARA